MEFHFKRLLDHQLTARMHQLYNKFRAIVKFLEARLVPGSTSYIFCQYQSLQALAPTGLQHPDFKRETNYCAPVYLHMLYIYQQSSSV